MKADFWHDKWQTNKIAFHQRDGNPMLVAFFDQLSLSPGSRVFVPLCGKSLDMGWLLSKGYRVVGVELSQLAIKHLFTDLDLTPVITDLGGLKHYSAPNIDIFVGDFFDMDRDMLGPVDAVYDRAALIALPKDLREKYCDHLPAVTNMAPQLLVGYEFDQEMSSGPPFSIRDEDARAYYQDIYDIEHLEHVELSDGLNGVCPAIENAWMLTAK